MAIFANNFQQMMQISLIVSMEERILQFVLSNNVWQVLDVAKQHAARTFYGWKFHFAV